jgi:hypothetical protein
MRDAISRGSFARGATALQTLDYRPVKLAQLQLGEQFAFMFDFHNRWEHLCRVARRRIDTGGGNATPVMPRRTRVLIRVWCVITTWEYHCRTPGRQHAPSVDSYQIIAEALDLDSRVPMTVHDPHRCCCSWRVMSPGH